MMKAPTLSQIIIAMISLAVVICEPSTEVPNTQRVIMELDEESNRCKGISINEGTLTVRNCEKFILVEDLQEKNVYDCNDVGTYLFFGPISVTHYGRTCSLLGLPVCTIIPNNPYVSSSLCPGKHIDKFNALTITLVVFSVLFPLLLIALFRWILLRKILGIGKGIVLFTFKENESHSFNLLFAPKEKRAKNRVGRTNILKVALTRQQEPNARNKPLYPNIIETKVDETLPAMAMTVSKVQLVLILLMTFNFFPVQSCLSPELSTKTSHLASVQEGSTICTNSGILRINEVYHMFSKTEQYHTAPWCMDTDGWHGNNRICGGKKLCQSRGITGIPNNTIEKSDIPYDEYCSNKLGFKETHNIRRMHCYYVDPDSKDTVWKGGVEWYYANCRDFRMRILFDMANQYKVSTLTHDFIHIRARESGSLSCKFHPFYSESYKSESLSLVESVNSPVKYICPMQNNHMNPNSGTLGDFQTKDNHSAVVDWMSFQCEAGIDHQKCIGKSSFISDGLKGCSKLPGYVGIYYFYMDNGQIMAEAKNSLISGTIICDKEESFIFDKVGNCTVTHASLWGTRLLNEQLRLVIVLASSQPNTCHDLKSSCLHHTHCIPCDGEQRMFYLSDNECTDLRLNFTDNTVTNTDITAVTIDYSYKTDAGVPGSAPIISEWFSSPLHLGLLGVNGSLILFCVISLLCLRK